MKWWFSHQIFLCLPGRVNKKITHRSRDSAPSPTPTPTRRQVGNGFFQGVQRGMAVVGHEAGNVVVQGLGPVR